MSTAYKIDFAEVKEKVGFEQLLSYLGITLRRANTNQFKGDCPLCKARKSIVVTLSTERSPTGVFHCFTCKAAGDQIELTSRMRGRPAKDKDGCYAAARELSERFLGTVRTVTGPEGTVPTVPRSAAAEENQATRSLTPLAYLQAEHDLVQALGVSKESAAHFEAGFASKGMMSRAGGGRLAVPIHTRDGTALVAYCGIAVRDDQQPELLFPKDFEHTAFIFNAHRAERGDVLHVCRTPIDALLAYDGGVTNVVSFFGDITADALHALALLMDEREIPSIEFY
jgi:hypothetical protein